jgi:cytoskeleton protein RodZ
MSQASGKKSISIGALLVNARNAAALSQVDVAEQINLPLQTINALETDDFDRLAEATYVRGYLRNYARVVGVSPDSLIKAYMEEHHSEPEVTVNIQAKQSYDSAILWSTAAVFTILAGLVITWWIDSKQVDTPIVEIASNESVEEQSNQATNVELSSQTSVNEKVGVANPEESTLPNFEKELQNISNSDEVITPDQQHAMEQELRNPNLVSLHEDDAQMLTVTYVEKSWTEIRDADANTLMEGLIEPGVVRHLKGKPPFEVFLGNSPGVIIEVNGLYFDHSQYSRSNRTARFQVSNGSLN